MVYHASALRECLSLQRSPAYAAILHPCSPNPLERYTLALPKARLTQRVVSPLWRHDHHDRWYRGSTREEFSFTGDVCDLSREGGTSVEGAPENIALQPGDRVIWWKRIP